MAILKKKKEDVVEAEVTEEAEAPVVAKGRCKECAGTGRAEGSDSIECPTCHGTGLA